MPGFQLREETERLRRLLSDPSRTTGRAPKYLLSGIARCGRCGAPLNGHRYNTGGSRRYHCFRQAGMYRCGRLSIIAPPLERHVTTALFIALADTSFRSGPTEATSDPTSTETSALQDMDNDRRRLDDLATDFGEGLITRGEWLRAREVIATRIDTAAASLRDERHSRVIRRLPESPTQLSALWPTIDLERQRAIIAAVIEQVVVNPVTSRRQGFDPSRVDVHWRA